MSVCFFAFVMPLVQSILQVMLLNLVYRRTTCEGENFETCCCACAQLGPVLNLTARPKEKINSEKGIWITGFEPVTSVLRMPWSHKSRFQANWELLILGVRKISVLDEKLEVKYQLDCGYHTFILEGLLKDSLWKKRKSRVAVCRLWDCFGERKVQQFGKLKVHGSLNVSAFSVDRISSNNLLGGHLETLV